MTPTKTALAEELAQVVAQGEPPGELGPYAKLGPNSKLLNLAAINADARYDDPRLDSYGPHLFAEVDEQMYAVYLLMGVVNDDSLWTYEDASTATRMTVVRANGHAAKSWSDEDYAEMAETPAPPPLRDYALKRPASRAEEQPRYKGSPVPAEFLLPQPAPARSVDPWTPAEGPLFGEPEAPACAFCGEPSCDCADVIAAAEQQERRKCRDCGAPYDEVDMDGEVCTFCAAMNAGATRAEALMVHCRLNVLEGHSACVLCPHMAVCPKAVAPPRSEIFPPHECGWCGEPAAHAAPEGIDSAEWLCLACFDAIQQADLAEAAAAVRQADDRLAEAREKLADVDQRIDDTLDALVASYEREVPELREAVVPEPREAGQLLNRLRHELHAQGDALPEQWTDGVYDLLGSWPPDTKWGDYAIRENGGLTQSDWDSWMMFAEEALRDIDEDAFTNWENHHDPDRPADPTWGEGEEMEDPVVSLAQQAVARLIGALTQNGPDGWEEEAQAWVDLYEPTQGWLDEANRLEAAWHRVGPLTTSPADFHDFPNFADEVADNDGYKSMDQAATAAGVIGEPPAPDPDPPSPPAPPPPSGNDGEPEAPSFSVGDRVLFAPVAHDPLYGEQHWRGKVIGLNPDKDSGEYDFTTYPYVVRWDSGLSEVYAADQLLPDTSEPPARGEEKDNAPRQPTYQSVPAEKRDAVVAEAGLKVRVQLTSYFAGKYLSGNNDNYMLPGVTGQQVADALQPLRDMALERYGKAKGAKRLRIQITEQAKKGSQYLKQTGDASVAFNVSVGGMTAEDGSPLVDYLLAAAFGERRRDAAELAVAWRRFESEPRLATEGGPQKPGTPPAQEEAPTSASSAVEIPPNAVQPEPPKTGVGTGPYTFEADGCAPCHLPSLVGKLDGEVDPQKDIDREWAIDFYNDPDFACNGELDHMMRLARKWKARFPRHEVVVREGGCQDSPYPPEADQLGKAVALIGVAKSDIPDGYNNPVSPNAVQPSGMYDPSREEVLEIAKRLRAAGHATFANMLVNAGGGPKREMYADAVDILDTLGEEVSQ